MYVCVCVRERRKPHHFRNTQSAKFSRPRQPILRERDQKSVKLHHVCLSVEIARESLLHTVYKAALLSSQPLLLELSLMMKSMLLLLLRLLLVLSSTLLMLPLPFFRRRTPQRKERDRERILAIVSASFELQGRC